MKRVLLALTVLISTSLTLSLQSCDGCGNKMAKKYGGTTTIQLPKGERLQSITWKDDDIWYLHRPMQPGETPTTWTYQERSSGVVDGKVIIKETN